jgi:hypothetical protein
MHNAKSGNGLACFVLAFPGAPLSGFRKWEGMKFKGFDFMVS